MAAVNSLLLALTQNLLYFFFDEVNMLRTNILLPFLTGFLDLDRLSLSHNLTIVFVIHSLVVCSLYMFFFQCRLDFACRTPLGC